MTRFARFGVRNKKPEEASSWKELQGKTQNSTQEEHETETIPASSSMNSNLQNENRNAEEKKEEDTLRKVKDKAQFKVGKKEKFKKLGKKKLASKMKDLSSVECYNCKEKGHKASQCPKHKEKYLEFQCFICMEMGHKSFQCTKKKESRKQLSHEAEKVEQKENKKIDNSTTKGKRPGHPANQRKERKSMECYNCKEMGHKSSECPKPSDGKNLEFQCFNCKEMGHKSFKCPKKESQTEFSQGAEKKRKESKKIDKSDVKWKEKRSELRRMKRQAEVQNKKLCFNCREAGHQLSECPKVQKDVEQGTGICFKCGSTEHAVNKCHVKLAPGEFPYAKCFICGETGHLSRQCPDNPRGLYPNGGCCKECGSVEHLRRDCPDVQKQHGIDSIKLVCARDQDVSADADNVVEQEDSQIDRPTEPKRQKKVVKF